MKRISKVYYNLIKKGEKTIDDIPNEEVKQEVKQLFENEGDNQ